MIKILIKAKTTYQKKFKLEDLKKKFDKNKYKIDYYLSINHNKIPIHDYDVYILSTRDVDVLNVVKSFNNKIFIIIRTQDSFDLFNSGKMTNININYENIYACLNKLVYENNKIINMKHKKKDSDYILFNNLKKKNIKIMPLYPPLIIDCKLKLKKKYNIDNSKKIFCLYFFLPKKLPSKINEIVLEKSPEFNLFEDYNSLKKIILILKKKFNVLIKLHPTSGTSYLNFKPNKIFNLVYNKIKNSNVKENLNKLINENICVDDKDGNTINSIIDYGMLFNLSSWWLQSIMYNIPLIIVTNNEYNYYSKVFYSMKGYTFNEKNQDSFKDMIFGKFISLTDLNNKTEDLINDFINEFDKKKPVKIISKLYERGLNNDNEIIQKYYEYILSLIEKKIILD